MRETLDLLRHEPRARLFFAALAQSSLGTGAGYVALLLIAYERFGSPWAISLVLIADLIPAMVLGPVFGALADRWSRKWCVVAGDALRAFAFAGVAVVDGFEATIFFALLAGVGTGAFTPAALAALPSVVDDKRHVPATSSLYGVVADLGFTVGPALAAAMLALGGPETVLNVNAVTFALSAVLLAHLAFGERPLGDARGPTSLRHEIGDGLRAIVAMRAIKVVLLGSAGALFCAGLFNVAELFYVADHLGMGDIGFAVLVAFFGAGFVGGSLSGAKRRAGPQLKRRYLLGLAAVGVSLIATGAVSAFPLAMVTFAFAGFGNGILLVHERLLIQTTVDDALVGRVFGAKDALTAWAFAVAFLAGGALLSVVEARELILGAGAVAVLVFSASAVALRSEWRSEPPYLMAQGASWAAMPRSDGGADSASTDGALGQESADVVGSGDAVGLESSDDPQQR
jgi:MFS family permease